MSPGGLAQYPFLVFVYAASIYLFSVLMAKVMLRFDCFSTSLTQHSNRFGSIDGLRGLLATSVFVSHSYVAYVYFTEGTWQVSPNALLNHLAMTSVALFFMITAFLFTIKASAPKIQWKRLYVSRLYRLFPLYAIVVLCVFAIVFLVSNGELRESSRQIATEFGHWVTFCCFGRPDINGYPKTWTIIAGVNWTLRIEILFYVVAVPSLHFFLRVVSHRVACIAAVSALIGLLAYRLYAAPAGKFGLMTLFAAHFTCGIVAALALTYPGIKSFCERKAFRYLSVAALVPFFVFNNADSWIVVLSTLIVFASVVGGSSLFGLLNTKAAIWLGDISYGIYLIHGMVLWLCLYLLREAGVIAYISLPMYWLIMLLVSAAVVVLSSFSYAYLEKPCMMSLR